MKRTKNHVASKKMQLGSALRIVFLMLFCFPFFLSASADNGSSQSMSPQQDVTITGYITDETGEPIIGASVSVVGTTNGTLSDLDGNFSIKANTGATLTVSYVGFHSKKIVVGKDTKNLKIILVEDAKVLDEVVVTAMGIERKAESLTYATDVVKGSELTRTKESNLVNSLQGKSAGLVITPNSTGAGGSSKILLRGNKSAQGNNQPLVVIDGIPMANPQTSQTESEYGGRDGGDAISNLNPDDIASINILKGASAAALYGSMAANGVILITTKKGEDGKVRADFSSNITFETPLVTPKLQTRYGAGESSPGNLNTQSWGPKLNSVKTKDRVDDFFRVGSNLINSISLTGGTAKAQSYFSYANTTAFGITPTNDFSRHNFTFRESLKLLEDKLSFDLSASYIKQKATNRPGGGTYYNPLSGVYSFPADGDFKDYKNNFEKYDAAKGYGIQQWYTTLSDFAQNPYWILNRNKSTDKRDRVMLSGTAKYTITPDLNIQGRLSYDRTDDLFERKIHASTVSLLVTGDNGKYVYESFKAEQIYGDVLLNYNKKINDFDLSASFGSSFLDYKTNLLYAGDKTSLAVPNIFTLQNYEGNGMRYEISPRKKLNSVFGTAQFGYKGMVYIDITGRNDWSSTLAYTPNWSYFYPSVGLTGIISEMAKMPELVNLLKVRASYSVVGNDVAPYITHPMPTISQGLISVPNKAPFATLKPEKIHSMEFGLDVALLDKRINFDITYYKTNSKNQYFEVKAPVATGYSNFFINTGNIQNEGVEFSGRYIHEFSSDFSWVTGVNASYNKNTVKELDPKLGKEVTIGEGAGFRFVLREGGSYGDIYTRKLQRDANGVVQLDNNGIPKVGQDYEYVGNVNSKWNVGWNNTFTYKDVSLYFLVDGKIGGKTVGMTQSYLDSYGVTKATADARDNGGVDIGNGTLVDTKTYYQAVAGKDKAGSEYVYNATNFRLRELSLGYTFKNLLGPSRNLGLSFVARNLFIIYKDAPHDPDMSMSTSNGYQGFDIFGLPSTRSYGLNLKLNF